MNQVNNEFADLLDDALRDYANYKDVVLQEIDVRAFNNILTVFIREDSDEQNTHEFKFKSGVLLQYKNKSLTCVDMNADSILTDPVGVSAARLLIDTGMVTTESNWIEIQ